MSKAFTKDDAWEEPVVPPRAPLPDGVPNYVTPRGLALLHSELTQLEVERKRIDAEDDDDTERRRRVAIVGRRTSELSARIATAVLVDAHLQPHDTVRFGARVQVRESTRDGTTLGEREIEIVGVDEADPAQGRVAFTAPIARALIGCGEGEFATLQTGRGETLLEILTITYPHAAV